MLNFKLDPELETLQKRAREVAADGVARFGRHNDSWINGFSKEFAQIMAAEGWIGMGLAQAVWRSGTPSDRASDRGRRDDRRWRADSGPVVR